MGREEGGRVGDEMEDAEVTYCGKERESNGTQMKGPSEAARWTNQKKG